MTTENIKVYAGGTTREGGFKHIVAPTNKDILVSAIPVETRGNPVSIKGPKAKSLKHLEVKAPPINIIEIDWPDHGIPAIGRDFWTTLWEELNSGKWNRCFLQCLGGHGRTGTMAAILVGLSGIVSSPQDAMKYVWDTYCKQAIETQSQEEYINSILS